VWPAFQWRKLCVAEQGRHFLDNCFFPCLLDPLLLPKGPASPLLPRSPSLPHHLPLVWIFQTCLGFFHMTPKQTFDSIFSFSLFPSYQNFVCTFSLSSHILTHPSLTPETLIWTKLFLSMPLVAFIWQCQWAYPVLISLYQQGFSGLSIAFFLEHFPSAYHITWSSSYITVLLPCLLHTGLSSISKCWTVSKYNRYLETAFAKKHWLLTWKPQVN
jgi:hypothetical protein